MKALKDTVENFEALEQEYEDIDTMIQMAEEENEPELVPEIQEMLQKFITDLMLYEYGHYCPANLTGRMRS